MRVAIDARKLNRGERGIWGLSYVFWCRLQATN